METGHVCKECDKTFSSQANLYVHKREKHTFFNTLEATCVGCLQNFNSVSFNTVKNKRYTKCEECRDLQKLLCTNDIVYNTYVYGPNKNRYRIDSGKAIKACIVHKCESSNPCNIHYDKSITQCKNPKCNNWFVEDGFSICETDRQNGNRSKDKTRSSLLEFKKELGGKCVDCGCDELFVLEFDHIDPSKKTMQITRSSPNAWKFEKASTVE